MHTSIRELPDADLAALLMAGAGINQTACLASVTTCTSASPTNGLILAKLLAYANELLTRQAIRSIRDRSCLDSIDGVGQYLIRYFRMHQYEAFVALWLDAHFRLICVDEMFRGTLTQTSVYPREVVKRGLELNACSVIVAHNHPSGDAEPSHADEALTSTLRRSLALVDLKLQDHFVVGGEEYRSMARMGLL